MVDLQTELNSVFNVDQTRKQFFTRELGFTQLLVPINIKAMLEGYS